MHASGQRAVWLCAERVGPEDQHAFGERSAPNRLVHVVRGAVRGDVIRRFVFNGHRHRVPGGTHVVVHRRDQRTQAQGHVGHVRQFQRGHRPPVGVPVGLFVTMENGHAGQLCGSRGSHRCHNHGNIIHDRIVFQKSFKTIVMYTYPT